MVDFEKPFQGKYNGSVVEVVPAHQFRGGRTHFKLWALVTIGADGGMKRYTLCGWEKLRDRVRSIAPFDEIEWVNVEQWSMVSQPGIDAKNCVYFIEAVGSGRVKIGKADLLGARLAGLSCASPFPLRVLLTVPGAEDEESELHERFAHLRVHREWFLLQGELLDYIEEHTNKGDYISTRFLVHSST